MNCIRNGSAMSHNALTFVINHNVHAWTSLCSKSHDHIFSESAILKVCIIKCLPNESFLYS